MLNFPFLFPDHRPAKAGRIMPALVGLILLAAPALPAQDGGAARVARPAAQRPLATDADTSSPRATVEAFFQTISAPKGGKLDQQRLQSLFEPSGRIAIPFNRAPGKLTEVLLMSPAEYALRSDQATAMEGFFDRVLAMHEARYGEIAQVFASYASRKSLDDPAPFVRGMKSFELVQRNSHWYITQVSWTRETQDNLIPEVFLKERSE